ncbi:MAG: CDP-diacylglycerol--serine O-phosphatidyltransferase, partial [Bacteroidota bacterium]
VLSIFSAIRLAKFNLDTRQSENFVGLNTPACTVFVVGLMLIYHFDSMGLRSWIMTPFLLYGSIVLLSFLLVAELPMMSFKFKHFRWNGNKRKIIFLLFSVVCLLVLQEAAFSLIIIIYVLFSFVDYLINPQSIIK